VQKGPDGNWTKVERTQEFNEQYGSYNHTLIGGAFFLSKLEEAAEVCILVNINGLSTTDHVLVDMAKAFDRRIVEIITQWRHFFNRRRATCMVIQEG